MNVQLHLLFLSIYLTRLWSDGSRRGLKNEKRSFLEHGAWGGFMRDLCANRQGIEKRGGSWKLARWYLPLSYRITFKKKTTESSNIYSEHYRWNINNVLKMIYSTKVIRIKRIQPNQCIKIKK